MELRRTEDGYLGRIAEGLTFQAVRKLAALLGQHVQARGGERVLVGYDTRFLARGMAEEAARVLGGMGLKAYLTKEAVPTPVLSAGLLELGAFGLHLTGGAEPAEFQGVRFRDPEGRPLDLPLEDLPLPEPGGYEEVDPFPAYWARLEGVLPLEALKATQGVVYYDAMGGAGSGVLAQAFRRFGVGAELRELRALPHPLFYGHPPDPRPEYLKALFALLKTTPGATLGLATDGAGERLLAVRFGGEVLPEEEVRARLEAKTGGPVELRSPGRYLLGHLPEPDPFLAGLLLL